MFNYKIKIDGCDQCFGLFSTIKLGIGESIEIHQDGKITAYMIDGIKHVFNSQFSNLPNRDTILYLSHMKPTT